MKPAIWIALVLGVAALSSAITTSAASSGGQAAVELLNASATISQTTDTAWTLKKTAAHRALPDSKVAKQALAYQTSETEENFQ
jgi:hypothetical protein